MAKDIYFSNVVLLLPLTGSNGSTAITDSSKNTKAITLLDNAQIATDVADPFGLSTGTGKFDGSADGIIFPNSNDFNFGAGDFTIEFFIYREGTNTNYTRIYNPDGDYYAGVIIAIDANNNLVTFGTSADGDYNLWSATSPVFIPLNTWLHCALVRHGNRVTMYVNGMAYSIATLPTNQSLYQSPQSNLCIGGQHGTNRSLNGRLSNFRVTKGVARYTGVFTPPAEPFLTNGHSMSVTLNESIAATDFIVRVSDLATGELLNQQTIQAGNTGVDANTDQPVCMTILPIQGKVWKKSEPYVVNDLVFPTNPTTTPYYYKRINAGTSGTTEPAWITTAGQQCNDGAVNNAWECVSRLTQPITHSPLIPI